MVSLEIRSTEKLPALFIPPCLDYLVFDKHSTMAIFLSSDVVEKCGEGAYSHLVRVTGFATCRSAHRTANIYILGTLQYVLNSSFIEIHY